MRRWQGTGHTGGSRSASATSISFTIPACEPRHIIVILGGTFDPVHLGHLTAAEQVQRVARLEEVWLMPNARPPHKVDGPYASAQDRLAMVERAVQERPGLRASDLEVRRGGVSYTVDTLAALASSFPGARFALVLGCDGARQVRSWHR